MAVKLIRGLSLYGSIDQVWQTAVPGFYIIGNCISYYIKNPHVFQRAYSLFYGKM